LIPKKNRKKHRKKHRKKTENVCFLKNFIKFEIRKTPKLDQIFEKIGSPDFKDQLNHGYGINKNIIYTLNSNFNKAVQETKEIAPLFKGSTPEKTCLNIWNFLKNKIKYVKDPDGYQFIKTPRRFLKEKTGDCKSFSLFSAGILKNIYPDAEVFLRYTAYGNLKIPSHVYTILKLNNFAYICDGVYNKPLKEKPYKHKEDYKMKIYTLSGFEDPINGKGRIRKAIKKATSSVKNVVKSAGGAVKNIGKGGAKTLALAPLRASFLALVKINLKNIARKLKEATEKDPQKIKNFWEKWGGNFDQLKQTIAEGSTKKMIGYVTDDDLYSVQHSTDEIGAVTAAAITTAAPIVLAVLGLIKSIIGDKREKELGDTSDLQKEAEKTTTTTDPDQVAEDKGAGAGAETTSTTFGMSTNTMLMIGAGAVALLLLMKKKK
jgi:hypothetical protein